MARYIDADKFTERTKASPAFRNIYDGLLLQRVVIDLLNNIPTADVVPKREFDELVYKLECFLCYATGGRLSKHTYDLRTMETVATDCINETYNDGYGAGYRDCAVEIIADMRELIKGYENIDVYLDRIEKKYTEEKE